MLYCNISSKIKNFYLSFLKKAKNKYNYYLQNGIQIGLATKIKYILIGFGFFHNAVKNVGFFPFINIFVFRVIYVQNFFVFIYFDDTILRIFAVLIEILLLRGEWTTVVVIWVVVVERVLLIILVHRRVFVQRRFDLWRHLHFFLG